MRKTIAIETVKKSIRRKPMPKSLRKGFIASGWEGHLTGVYLRAAELFAEHADASPALHTHLEQLLPCIAFYETVKRITGSQEEAIAFFDKWAFIEIEKLMPMVRGVMKLGLYRLMPTACGWMLDRMFGEKAGFAYRAVPGGRKFSVDMIRCPYVEICRKYGCPEMAQFACRADDITYGNLHPRLNWARTQTLGTGGECCDFRLHLKED
ncbi:MAG: L-2-amino-thiazoline-4-carboxylic acid hydrolase [Clostridia bacterium]|nr:L-2-amino-thiazoline-4-carboxylic acid hydrolase [Clostridia bacterium]